jgi:hypothetical protein
VKSVLNFLSPSQIKDVLERNGFTEVIVMPHSGWRALVQHTILAKKLMYQPE